MFFIGFLSKAKTLHISELLALVLISVLVVGCGGSDGKGAIEEAAIQESPEAPVASMRIISGDDQIVLTSTQTSSPIILKVSDESGTPVKGAEVSFSVASGDGSVAYNSVTSDADGNVSNYVMAGQNAGAIHIEASSPEEIKSKIRVTSVLPDPQSNQTPESHNQDWTTQTHTNVSPNYSQVFNQNAVQSIHITMTEAQWNSIHDDMNYLFGYGFGERGGFGGGFECQEPNPEDCLPEGLPEGEIPPIGELPEGGFPPGELPEGAGGLPGGDGVIGFADNSPSYIPVTVRYNGAEWKHVGFRLKGNSSLSQSWGGGNYKVPFRLNFDKFEDPYPAIDNQRFYGFDELSFSPGAGDTSVMREKAAADIFRMAGVPSAQGAFYRVYIDVGADERYVGVYAMLEVIDDTMVETTFGEDDGNIYKPESTLASFSENNFEKKNNKSEGDFTDVQSFITILNSEDRLNDPDKWREDLSNVFNVDMFLHWLAVSNAIVSWDSYGNMAHNYYLYNHSLLKLTWIPWDHNDSLTGSPGVNSADSGESGGRFGAGRGLSLEMDEVTERWPLIRYFIDDPIYYQTYRNHLNTFYTNVFTESNMGDMFSSYHDLISPYVIGVDGEQDDSTYTTEEQFSESVDALNAHVTLRREVITTFLSN